MTQTRGPQSLDRRLALDLARVTERAAVVAARLRGRGDEQAADEAAMVAAYGVLAQMTVRGHVVIGEGLESEVSHLWLGQEVGAGGELVDLAVDALEGATLCAKDMPGSISVIVLAEHESLLKAPPVYMEKIAIGPGYPADIVSLNAPAQHNIAALAQARGVPASKITALILDRPRHAGLIEAVRAAGAAVKLITDGDVAGIIHTTNPKDSGVDIYLGIGGAAEGVLAAAALRCIGGQMQGRLVLDTESKREQARRLGIRDFNRIYTVEDMVRGDCLVAVTGVTDGPLLAGVRFSERMIATDTLLMRAATGTVRRILTEHRDLTKFKI